MPPPSTVFAHVLIRGVFRDGDCLPAVGSEGVLLLFIFIYFYCFLSLFFLSDDAGRACSRGQREKIIFLYCFLSLLLFIFIVFAFFKGK